ncbi:MAG: class I SAM-dependent methyltransferase [marine benthic group bacterium]|nr:class I SAM-dependent methyltransferase [Gemmatimonadota bacterium]
MPGYHWLPDRLKTRAQSRRGRRDRLRLSRDPRGFGSGRGLSGQEVDALIQEIPERLAEYIRETGTDEIMAASIELCRFLVRWCEVRRPGRIVDLGSGITSWTLRSWRDRFSPDSTVISVDDDPEWLARSRDYSRTAGTGDVDFLLWDEFLEKHGSDRFDLVVYDFGSVRERARQMATAFDLVAPGGAIICDDIHKARIWRAARNSMWRRGWTGWSLREETLDSIGRFALLVGRPPERV